MPVDGSGTPLALDPKWSEEPAAMAWLWKDHTSAEEADAITRIAAEHNPEYLAPIGGTCGGIAAKNLWCGRGDSLSPASRMKRGHPIRSAGERGNAALRQ